MMVALRSNSFHHLLEGLVGGLERVGNPDYDGLWGCLLLFGGFFHYFFSGSFKLSSVLTLETS